MRRWAMMGLGILALALAPVRADDSSVVLADRMKAVTLHSGVVVAAGATSALSSVWSTGFSEVQSLQVTVSSSASPPSLAILVTGSVDGTTFGSPSSGPTVTTITADGTYMIALTQPLSVALRIQLSNASATVNSTVTVKGAAQ